MAVIFANEENFIWEEQPQPFNWKFEIDGTDVSDDVLVAEITKASTDTIGSFVLQLNNATGNYTYNGGETFIFYADLADASTKIFEGKVEKVNNDYNRQGYIVLLEGSHVSLSLLDKTITKSYSNTYVSNIVKNLVSEYLSGYTTTNVEDINISATVNWSNRAFLDVMKDLCDLGNCDFYVDDDKDFHFFTKESKLCTTDAISGEKTGNLISLSGFGINTTEVKNNIIVYGQDENGLPIIATSPDATSQTSYGTKDFIINDTDIGTYEEALDRAVIEKDMRKDTKTTGSVVSRWLLGLNPADKLWVSIPDREIHGKYVIRQFTHRFPSLSTTVEIYKKKDRLPELLKKRVQKDLQNQNIINPDEMSDTYNFAFNDTTDLSLTNTAVTQGELVLSSGTSGTAESAARSSDSTITSIRLRVSGQDLGASTFEISANNGVTWDTVSLDQTTTLSSTGKNLKWKATLTSDSDNTYPKMGSLSLAYK